MTEVVTGNVDSTRLKSFIDRIERLEQEKKNIQEDIKEAYAEAKSVGFEVKALRKVIKKKQISENPKLQNKADEEQYYVDTYESALGLNSEG